MPPYPKPEASLPLSTQTNRPRAPSTAVTPQNPRLSPVDTSEPQADLLVHATWSPWRSPSLAAAWASRSIMGNGANARKTGQAQSNGTNAGMGNGTNARKADQAQVTASTPRERVKPSVGNGGVGMVSLSQSRTASLRANRLLGLVSVRQCENLVAAVAAHDPAHAVLFSISTNDIDG